MSETEDPGISLDVLRNFRHMRNRPTIISYKPPEGKKQLEIDWVPENLGSGLGSVLEKMDLSLKQVEQAFSAFFAKFLT